MAFLLWNFAFLEVSRAKYQCTDFRDFQHNRNMFSDNFYTTFIKDMKGGASSTSRYMQNSCYFQELSQFVYFYSEAVMPLFLLDLNYTDIKLHFPL